MEEKRYEADVKTDEARVVEEKTTGETPAVAAEVNTAEKKKKSRKKIIIVIVALLLLAAAILAALKFCSEEERSPVAIMPGLDANAQDITTREELTDAMQEAADASYFTLQVNPEASFSSDTGEGTFEMVNPSVNVYPISFQLYLDEDGSLLYESGVIMPNQMISGITLDQKPSPGTYKATVKVLIYNPDDNSKEGETEAKITMYVS